MLKLIIDTLLTDSVLAFEQVPRLVPFYRDSWKTCLSKEILSIINGNRHFATTI